MTGIDLAWEIRRSSSLVEAELERLLPLPEGRAACLSEAMRYAALGGGKRLRAFLVHATSRLFDDEPTGWLRVGAALELVHAYSLVHDDLPAMDDARLRRGRPACHRQYGEAAAILAGDALQALAFEVLTRDDWPAPPELKVNLVRKLAAAAGAAGMCGGQMIDLLAEKTDLGLDAILELNRRKTGALISYACEAGCLLGAADADAHEAVLAFAADLGLAFQIKDDLLDATGDEGRLGKDAGSDARAGKATLVALKGVGAAEDEIQALCVQARERLHPFGERALLLRALFDFVINRES